MDSKLPKGFLGSGLSAGIKEEKNRKDLGLLVCENDAILGGVYTQNRFPSAHVQYCKPLTPSSKFRALIVNSGNANAATGSLGLENNKLIVAQVAEQLDISPDSVFTSSTGIIGQQLPLDIISTAVPPLISDLKSSGQDFAEAIMTTDLKVKTASAEVVIDDQSYLISGFAKGSGMIHPNMATMLAYIVTDAPLPTSEIQPITEKIASESFNCISVDGDTSTNDTFLLISSNPVDDLTPDTISSVKEAILEVAITLAKKIAADGEGAEHLLEVRIAESPSKEIAKKLLDAILTSNLVKTAVHGKDPNWGRILMAAGNGLPSDWSELNPPISIKIQSVPVYITGEPASFDEKALSEKMSQFNVVIEVLLHSGHYSLTGWGCDFSKEYVTINADYST